MMSTPILLALPGKQMTVHPSSGDQGTPESVSFASNLSEQVEESTPAQGDRQPVRILSGLLKTNIEPGSKRLDKIADVTTGSRPDVKEGVLSELGPSKNGVLKSPVFEAAVASGPEVTVAKDAKAIDSGPVAKRVDLSELNSSAPESLPTAVAPANSPIVATKDNSSRLGDIESDHPSVPNGGNSAVVPSTFGIDDPPRKAVSIGASVKIQKGDVAQKASPKAISTGQASHSVMPSLAAGSPPVGTLPVVAQAVASAVVPLNDGAKSLPGKVAVSLRASEPSVQAVPSLPAGMVLKESRVEPGTNPTNTNAGNTGKVDGGVTSSSEAAGGLDKAAAVSVPQGNAAGGKSPTDEPIAAIDHPAPVIGLVPGVFGGVFPHVSPAGDPPLAKLHASETTVPSTNEIAPLREQSEGISATPFDGAPRMLMASPTELEVGIPNGIHGWLRVRAEMTDGGSVNASVSAASASGQEMLHRELHSLTAYLVEEKVAINAVVVHTPTPPAVAQQSFAGTGDLAGRAGQGANEGKQQQQYAGDSASTKPGERTAYGSSSDAESDGGLQPATFATGGNWLSVRA